MSLFRLKAPKLLQKPRCFSTVLPHEDQYTATPNYPPILDLSFEKKLERKKAAVHEEIKAVKTVEEKQIKLNMLRYYGFKCYVINEDKVPYNSLNFVQHCTRTHLIVNENLPEYYKGVDSEGLDLKAEVEEALLIEIEDHRRKCDIKKDDLQKSDLENLISGSISKQLNRIIVNKLAKNLPHLVKAQVDHDPRIETFWYAGGMNPPENVKRYRKGLDHLKEFENKPTDRGLVYLGSPTLTLRSELPLAPILPTSECENPDLKVPYFQYDPRVLGIATEHRFMANVPGFWPGDPNQFGLLSFHKRGHILERSRFGDTEDDKEALHCQGILSSFAWLHAQSNFLGFNTFNDVTYPTVGQTVITNGQLWSFYTYQLNTTLLHSENVTNNPKKNICWATPELKLYEELIDGKIVGLNENVLQMLLKFYANAPQKRLGVNLRPYLSPEEKLAADYELDEKRIWLEREYKHLVSNRPRHIPIDEVWSWEKIYKIDHKTRFMDKKLRFFELKKRPQDRTLDSRLAEYIPRALRPDLPRHKGRYKDEFFP